MIDKLLSFLTGEQSAAPSDKDDLQLAVAALLVEAAWRDDVFDQEERAAVEQVLCGHFGISNGEAKDLVATVEAKGQAGQLFGFTSKIVKAWEEPERIQLIEMLWEVAYADGVLDPQEDALIRKVAGLIYVTDQERGFARKRVRARLGLA
ncbi:MAG: TerB family tellurite resistance protein [Rhodospirillaceae bacterium]|nr:TerB family tellurite resistance protein [Rhodospirillaceae bacterium]